MTEETKNNPCENPDGPTKSANEATEADRECARKKAEEQAKANGSGVKIDFVTFCFSLGTQAMALLGETKIPGAEVPLDLNAAKQTIDILEMLRDKTKGNLTENESKLVSNLLYDLHMKYVQVSKKQG